MSIGVKDLERSAKWYTDVLGLPEIWRMDDRHMRGYGVGDNSATINLEQSAKPGMEIIVQVERVADARAALEAKGVRFEGDTMTIPNIGKAAKLRDPDGNALMLLDYTIEHGEKP